MPFLRAKLIPRKDNRTVTTKKKSASACDEKIAEIVQAWIREDDFSTAQELAELGL